MKYPNLRIACAALGGFACLLLIALWVRSSKWADIIVKHVSTTEIRIDSGAGFVAVQFSKRTLPPMWHRLDASHFVGRLTTHTYATEFPKPNAKSKVWGHFEFSAKHRGLCVPYWMLILVVSAVVAALLFGMRWRFSLRALLIGMTLLAVSLALIGYAMRA